MRRLGDYSYVISLVALTLSLSATACAGSSGAATDSTESTSAASEALSARRSDAGADGGVAPIDDDSDDDDSTCTDADAGTDAGTGVVTVESVRYEGSGCPEGSVVASILPDGQLFSLLFNSFTAQAGLGVDASEATRSCRVELTLGIPSGRTATITSVDTGGFHQLDTGVTATETSTYRFPGRAVGRGTSTFTGPTSDNYVREDTVASTTTSRCGGTARAIIDSSLVVSAPVGASGLVTVDTTDGTLGQTFHVALAPCACDPHHGHHDGDPCGRDDHGGRDDHDGRGGHGGH